MTEKELNKTLKTLNNLNNKINKKLDDFAKTDKDDIKPFNKMINDLKDNLIKLNDNYWGTNIIKELNNITDINDIDNITDMMIMLLDDYDAL